MTSFRFALLGAAFAAAVVVGAPSRAQQSGESLARDLANPLSTLTRVPLEFGWDREIGPDRQGDRYTLRALPTLPVDLSRDWNLILRTDARLVTQSDVAPGSGRQYGFGDTLQHVLFAPKRPASGGFLWGAGPAVLLPTGTDGRLTDKKYGLGPSGALVLENGPYTYGATGHHLWSVAGEADRPDLSRTTLQPFAAYTTRDAWTFSVDAESTYDWKAKQGILPVTLSASKLTLFEGRALSIGGGLRYYLDSNSTGPHGYGFRLTATFVFP